jgi:hypothetical protein
MAEIPDFVWMGVGIFIGLFSLFLGFLRPVEYSIFFKIMTFVGAGMFAFGYVKMKLSQKTTQQKLEEHRQQMVQRGDTEVDIDIDDYRNNPQLRQQAMQKPYSGSTQNPGSHYNTPGTYQQPTRPTQSARPLQQTVRQQPQQMRPTDQRTVQSHPAQRTQTYQSQPVQKGSFCHQCGTPLLKHHKYCPICGAKV